MLRRNRKSQLRLDQRSSARTTSLLESLESRQMLSGSPGRTPPPAAGTWTTLNHSLASDGIGLMMLQTDGSVMVHGGGASRNWYRLAPDASGNYVNGNWSQLGSMNAGRLYF